MPKDIKIYLSRKYLPIGVYFILDAVFLLVVLFLGYKVFGLYQKSQNLESEVQMLQQSAQLIKNNKSLLQSNISEYNDTLDKLLPDTETYFQVISALERLETRLGVKIDSYSINLSETADDVLSLDLVVRGSRESIESLLQNYHFYGGRLITNEKLQFVYDENESINFTVKLFHVAPELTGLDSPTADMTITSEDIAQIESIREQL